MARTEDTPLNWNLLDEQWALRHEAEQFAAVESALDAALFHEGDDHGYPLLWRWARLSHFRGLQAGDSKAEVARHFDTGAVEAKKALAFQPHRVEGHYWYGVNVLEGARRHGFIAVGRALPIAAQHIERAMNIDEEYLFAGPLRMWGRITHLKPIILGGSLDRAIDVYRRMLQVAPENSTNLLYYAEALFADRQPALARQMFHKIIDAPDDDEWRREQELDRETAREFLKKMGPKS